MGRDGVERSLSAQAPEPGNNCVNPRQRDAGRFAISALSH